MRTSELKDAQDAFSKLLALATPGSKECSLPDAVKVDVSLYVRSWILPQVERWLARVERKADKRRKHGGYEVGQEVEYRLDSGSWVHAKVIAAQPARGVARNRIPGKVTVRTTAGQADYTLRWRSQRLRRI